MTDEWLNCLRSTKSLFDRTLIGTTYYRELAPVDPARLQQGELRSEVMFKEDKKYHIDLKVIRGLFFTSFGLLYLNQS